MSYVYFLTGILAACSLLYELLIAQALSVLAANSVMRYSVTIGVYLGAMGFGALSAGRLFSGADSRISLGKVECVLSVLGGSGVAVIHAAHMLFTYFLLQGAETAGLAIFFSCAAAVIIAIGFFSGVELPLLIGIAQERLPQTAASRVLAADYFGSLAAGLLFPLVLLPRLELAGIGFLIAFVNALVACMLLAEPAARRLVRTGPAVACAVVLVVCFLRQERIEQYFLKRYYYYYEYYNRIRNFTLVNYLFQDIPAPPVERYGSVYQKIDLVNLLSYGDPFTPAIINAYSSKFRHDKEFPRRYALFLNGDYQFWTDFEEIYHEYFAHVPMILNQKVPARILVLGAGDGLLVRELLKYPDVTGITVVELDRVMVDLARNHPVLSYANKHFLDDGRVRVVINDAYSFVRNCPDAYDAVYVDFPDPKDFDLSRLYSREFFHFLKQVIGPGGYAVINAPGIGQFTSLEDGGYRMDRDNAWEIYHATLSAAGFEQIVPYASILEQDNSRALEALGRMLERVESFEFTSTDPEQPETLNLDSRQEMARQILKVHANDLIAAFIMVTPEQRELSRVYQQPRVPLYVLNEVRFGLAFSLPFQFPLKVNAKKVNSVTRPRLPNTPFWWVRTSI